MKVENHEQYIDLVPLTLGAKKKINTYAVLTPNLAEAFQQSDMSPESIMVLTVHHIRSSAPPKPVAVPIATTGASGDTSDTSMDSTNAILKQIRTPYVDLLRFLSGIQHYDRAIATPKTCNLQDEDTMA